MEGQTGTDRAGTAARRLGLSPATVSRALGGYSDVSASSRERVRQLATVGYQPDQAARQVALGRSDAVGMVYSPANEFLGNPAFRETLEGLAHVCAQSGWDLLFAAVPRDVELPVYVRVVRGRRVDALVVAHTRRVDERVDYLRRARFPFVAYGRTQEPDGFPWFDVDNAQSSVLAVERLVSLGHRRIAHVHAPLEFNFAWRRREGFHVAMARAGLPVPPGFEVDGSLDRRTGYAAGQHLLALYPRPTAIVVDTSIGGIGLIRALLDAQVSIGRTMSIVINGGIPEDTLFSGMTVAAVHQPTPYRSGQVLGEMVKRLLGRGADQTPALADLQRLEQPVYVDGNSVGPPPV